MSASAWSRGGTERVPYRVAGAAARQAMARARNARCTLRQHVVLEAVLAFTATYSKLSDEVPLRVIARLTRLSVDEVADELKALAELGIVYYRPGGGRGRYSVVGIPPADEGGMSDTPLSLSDDLERCENGGDPPGEKGGTADPPPYTEEVSEKAETRPDTDPRPPQDAAPPVGKDLVPNYLDVIFEEVDAKETAALPKAVQDALDFLVEQTDYDHHTELTLRRKVEALNPTSHEIHRAIDATERRLDHIDSPCAYFISCLQGNAERRRPAT